jgi:hypothetical protein
VRKVEIIKGSSHLGLHGFFHGFFQFGTLQDGCDGMAIVEFYDGSCDFFSVGYIRFLSQPAESNTVDGMAQPITGQAQNAGK